METSILPTKQLTPYLRRIAWRLRLRDGLLLAQQTLWQAGVLSLLILLAGRIWPIEQPWKWALVPLAAWFVGVVAYALIRPLSMMRVARRADSELRLKERLSTSLALDASHDSPIFASFQPNLVQKTYADAIHAAQNIDPARDFPLHAIRKPLITAGVILLISLLMLWLPNPMDSVIRERKAVAEEAKRQAEQVEKLRQQVQNVKEMSPEERDELLRKLAELSKQLRSNTGSREQALANLSKLEEALRQKLDPKASQRQAALEAMAAQLQAMAKAQNPQIGDLQAAAEALKKLAEQMPSMSEEERQTLAQQLTQMASRAAQAGDGSLAQALSAMAQAARSGDSQAMQQASQQASNAMTQSRADLANQSALSQTLSQLQNSRQALSQAGQQRASSQSNQNGQGQNSGQGQNPGQGQGQGQGNNPGQGGQSAGGGGGTNANSLPPSTRTGKAGKPQGAGKNTGVGGDTSSQVYVPREKRPSGSGEITVPGQDTNQGETQTKEQRDPLAGVNNPSLVPYSGVFQAYKDAAGQAIDQSYIPPGLKDYIREYFTQLEP